MQLEETRGATPLIATERLGASDSRLLCRHLGDRGFEGTGAAAAANDHSVSDCNGDDRTTVDGTTVDEDFLLGSMGRVLWRGANHVAGTLVELGARCVPVITNHRQCQLNDQVEEAELIGRMLSSEPGAVTEPLEEECANDEALARAMQEWEWYEARQNIRYIYCA